MNMQIGQIRSGQMQISGTSIYVHFYIRTFASRTSFFKRNTLNTYLNLIYVPRFTYLNLIYVLFKYVKQSTYIEFEYVKRSTYIEFEYLKQSTYIKF
jgi:hypothetical protein